MKIQHVQLSIPGGSLEEARKFYTEVLALPEVIRPGGLSQRPGFWLGLSHGQEIHFAEDPQAKPADSKAHLALILDGNEDIESRLLQKGVVIEKRFEGEGLERFHFRDPFGNRIELMKSLLPQREDEVLNLDFPKGDLERVLSLIEKRVEAFLAGDQRKLMQWLYRLDVAEKSVKAIWDNVAERRWAQRISELIFQRELQKYFNRRHE